MSKFLKIVSLLTLGIIALLGIGGCGQAPGGVTTVTDNPTTGTSDSTSWVEVSGFFFSKDLTRAQAEIPFTIVLPAYLPPNQGDYVPTMDIMGPVKAEQTKGAIELKIMYTVNFSGNAISNFVVHEYDYSALPPENNDYIENMEIAGMNVVKTKDFMQTQFFFFSYDDIYFVVDVYNLPVEEAHKIVESIITQFA